MGGRGGKRSADQVLVGCAPAVVALAGALRGQLAGMIDGVVEEADPARRRIRFRRRDVFAYLEPMADHIRLGFAHGDVLPDLTGRLEPAEGGTVRQLALRTVEEIGAREVKMLLSAALFDDDTHGFRRRR